MKKKKIKELQIQLEEVKRVDNEIMDHLQQERDYWFKEAKELQETVDRGNAIWDSYIAQADARCEYLQYLFASLYRRLEELGAKWIVFSSSAARNIVTDIESILSEFDIIPHKKYEDHLQEKLDEEREACAQKVDECWKYIRNTSGDLHAMTALKNAAKEIRSRKFKK